MIFHVNFSENILGEFEFSISCFRHEIPATSEALPGALWRTAPGGSGLPLARRGGGSRRCLCRWRCSHSFFLFFVFLLFFPGQNRFSGFKNDDGDFRDDYYLLGLFFRLRRSQSSRLLWSNLGFLARSTFIIQGGESWTWAKDAECQPCISDHWYE